MGAEPISRPNLKLLGIALSLLVAVAFVSCWHFFREPARPSYKLPIVKDGVTLSRVSERLAPKTPHVVARSGDWLLASKSVSVTVGSDGVAAQRHSRSGVLLDLATSDFSADRLDGLRTVLFHEGKPVPLTTERTEPEAGEPRLLIVQSSGDGRFKVSTRVSLEPKQARVVITSTVENTSESRLARVQLGDQLTWPGTLTFAPRTGFVDAPGHHEAAWIAREGPRLSYALAFHGGPVDVDFRFDRVGSSENVALGNAVDLSPGDTLDYSRSLSVSDQGLAGVVAQALRALGRKLVRVSGRVEPAPRWGAVEVRYPDGKPFVETTVPTGGHFELWLPSGEYDLVLRAPGGRYVEHITVANDPVTVRLLAPSPGTLRYVIEDETGAPSPARLSLRGVPPTKNPDFGSRQVAAGVRNVAYTTTGSGALELPPGRYRVLVTRGFEYGIYDETVEVTQAAGASIRVRLERVVDTSGWISGDFHVHAAPSFDSSVELPDRVASLIAEGVEFAVATDHNHVTDYADTIERGELKERLGSSPGIEVTTKSWGHFIAFPYSTAAVPPPYEGVDPSDIFAAIRERSPAALIQVNHPRMAPIAYFAQLKYAKDVVVGQGEALGEELMQVPEGFSFAFDTLEVVNGFELEKPEAIVQNVRDWFALLNVGFKYTAVGNSDSHTLVHQWAGYPRTYVRVSDDRPARVSALEVASSLLQGRAQISNGIFLEVRANDNAQIGDRITASDGIVNLSVVARAAPWVDVKLAEVWVNGKRSAETKRTAAPRESNRVQWRERLKLERDAWVVVIVRGAVDLSESYPGGRGLPFAISNPIFVDVDGDGDFTAPLAANEKEVEARSEAVEGASLTSGARSESDGEAAPAGEPDPAESAGQPGAEPAPDPAESAGQPGAEPAPDPE